MGFVLVVFFSWAYELTPQGLVRTDEVPRSQSITPATGKKINFAITGLLLLAIGFMAFDQYVLEEREGGAIAESSPADSEEAGPTTSPRGSTGSRLANSVAVLPFENLSPDPNDAYFADGLHEEILNQLAKLSDLSVISRTTMMRYSGQDKSLPEIADELNVETVMEGSVRYAGQRIRVTVQLIDPETDLHLISDTYNADISNLDEIFNIQSNIAMRVANVLQAEFSPTEQARIEQIPTDSPEAWSEYLAAKALNNRFTTDDFLRAFDRIDRVLELDPEFGLAWAEKARMYANAIPFFPDNASEYAAIADEALRLALATGSEIPEVHAQAAMVLTVSGSWRQVESELSQAVALGMSQAEANGYTLFRIGTGRVGGLVDGSRRLLENDPLNPAASFWVTSILDAVGDSEAAMSEYERGRTLFDDAWVGHFNALVVLLGSAEHERAKELAPTLSGNPVVVEVLSDFDHPEDALRTLRSLYESGENTDLVARQTISILAAYFGDEQLSLSAMRDSLSDFAVSAYLWRPVFSAVRQHEEFKTLARDFGFVAYWREYGWPDTCTPLGENDFECH